MIGAQNTRCIPAEPENGSGVVCQRGDTLGIPPLRKARRVGVAFGSGGFVVKV